MEGEQHSEHRPEAPIRKDPVLGAQPEAQADLPSQQAGENQIGEDSGTHLSPEDLHEWRKRNGRPVVARGSMLDLDDEIDKAFEQGRITQEEYDEELENRRLRKEEEDIKRRVSW